MRVVAIGRTEWLYRTIEKLVDDGHEIVAIITSQHSPESTKNEEDFKTLSSTLGCQFFVTKSITQEIIDSCKDCDVAVSINWVSMIHQEFMDQFRIGVLNCHPGNLPRFRGNACTNWTMLLGEKELVNSVHIMQSKELDCGPVINQAKYPLTDTTTVHDLYLWTEENMALQFSQSLKSLEEDPNFSLKYADPDSPESFRCYPRIPQDSFIDWTQDVEQIDLIIRASNTPFVGAYTYMEYKGEVKKLHILKSRVHQTDTNDIFTPGHVLSNDKTTGESLVGCGKGILAISECYHPGGDIFQPGNEWKSIRLRLGLRAEDMIWALINTKKEDL